MKALPTISILLTLAGASHADTLSSAQAKDHIGETATVCGHVADTRYLDTGSHVTFLNFDKPYPNHSFTAFIPAQSRAKIGTPERDYKDKDICVTGKIEDYRGKPEIVVNEPQQIKAK